MDTATKAAMEYEVGDRGMAETELAKESDEIVQ